MRAHTLNQGELPNKLSAVMTPKNPHAVKPSGSNSQAQGPNAMTTAINAFASGAKVKRAQSSQQLLAQATAGPSSAAAVAAGGPAAGGNADSSAVCVVQ